MSARMTASVAAVVAFCIGAALAGGSASLVRGPDPTPQIITTTRVVEVELPTPTPITVVKTVEREIKVATPVTPQACLDALDAGDAVIAAFSDFLDAMIDGRWKKADAATDASGEAMDDFLRASTDCRYADFGS